MMVVKSQEWLLGWPNKAAFIYYMGGKYVQICTNNPFGCGYVINRYKKKLAE